MNRKISSNMSIILLVIVLGLSYAYMNLPDNIRLSMTGGGKGPEIPGECIPMMYKFRYLFYFFLIFMIIFVVRYYIYFNSTAEYTYSTYMIKFFDQWAKDVNDANGKPVKITPEEKIVYDATISSFSSGNQYDTYGRAFCLVVAPCDCCVEPGYQHPSCPSGTPGYIKPGTPGYIKPGTPSV